MSTSIRKKYFELVNLNNPKLNKEVIETLFCDVLNIDKKQLFLNFDIELSNEEIIDEYVKRIIAGEPYQYVVNKAIFLGNEFYVNPAVLIPRQETEQLVIETTNIIKSFKENLSIIDVGTGSGNIAISLEKSLQTANICGIDISKDALEVANKNKDIFGSKVKFVNKDIFDDIDLSSYDVIISNPPYIKDESTVEESTLKFEPHLALFAEPQLCFYERMISLFKQYSNVKLCAFEIEEDMQERLTAIISKQLKEVVFTFRKDLYGKTRFLFVLRKHNSVLKAAEILNNHGVISFATDTVMGLAVKYDDKIAYDRLNTIKRRPENKPYTLMVAKPQDINQYAYVDVRAQKIIDAFLPGPLTLLLKAKRGLPYQVGHGTGIIGVRVAPNDEVASIIKSSSPLLVPSANRSGETPCSNSVEVRINMPEVDYVLDGCAGSGISTTIVDLTSEQIKIIREGNISINKIEKVLKE